MEMSSSFHVKQVISPKNFWLNEFPDVVSPEEGKWVNLTGTSILPVLGTESRTFPINYAHDIIPRARTFKLIKSPCLSFNANCRPPGSAIILLRSA